MIDCGKHAYIEEDCVTVGISITLVNAIESLGELHVANVSTYLRIHVEAHCLAEGFAVVHVVIAVEIEDVWCIGQNCRNSYLQTKSSSSSSLVSTYIKGVEKERNTHTQTRAFSAPAFL